VSTDPATIATLDQYYPPCGPCAFCGHTDKRHRLWDAILDAPEDDAFVAWEYELDIAHVKAVRLVRPYRTTKKEGEA
jgi:hypothetical protein